MFENDSDILYYVVDVDAKTFSLFNRATDTLILADVSYDKIKEFLLKNNPIHPALGSSKQLRNAPGSSPVIIPTKRVRDSDVCSDIPNIKRVNRAFVKQNKLHKKATPPKPIDPPKIDPDFDPEIF